MKGGRSHLKRRVEITVETERVLLVRGRSVSFTAWCPGCEARVRMVTAGEAAHLSELSAREIFRRVESGALHFAETAEGELLVCRESLNGTSHGPSEGRDIPGQ
jgi:hypothetical protein